MQHNVINLPTTPTEAWEAYARLCKAAVGQPELVGDPDYRAALSSAHARFQRIFVEGM